MMKSVELDILPGSQSTARMPGSSGSSAGFGAVAGEPNAPFFGQLLQAETRQLNPAVQDVISAPLLTSMSADEIAPARLLDDETPMPQLMAPMPQLMSPGQPALGLEDSPESLQGSMVNGNRLPATGISLPDMTNAPIKPEPAIDSGSAAVRMPQLPAVLSTDTASIPGTGPVPLPAHNTEMRVGSAAPQTDIQLSATWALEGIPETEPVSVSIPVSSVAVTTLHESGTRNPQLSANVKVQSEAAARMPGSAPAPVAVAAEPDVQPAGNIDMARQTADRVTQQAAPQLSIQAGRIQAAVHAARPAVAGGSEAKMGASLVRQEGAPDLIPVAVKPAGSTNQVYTSTIMNAMPQSPIDRSTPVAHTEFQLQAQGRIETASPLQTTVTATVAIESPATELKPAVSPSVTHATAALPASNDPATPAVTTRAVHQIATPVNQSGWDQAIGSRIDYMVRHNQQIAELRLNPASLGVVEVRISTEADKTDITFFAQNPATRELLEAAMPRLRESLNANGVQLDQAQVSDDAMPERQAGSAPDQDGRESRSGESAFQTGESGAGETLRVVKSDTLVDTYI